MNTIVDSPLPSDEQPLVLGVLSAGNPPPPRSGVPLELAELCRFEVHECEIAVSILLADRAETDFDEIGELRTGIVYLDRLMGCITPCAMEPYRKPAPRQEIAELIGAEGLKESSKLFLYSIAIWRWDGQVETLLQLQRLLTNRLARLESNERKAGGS